MQLVFNTSHSEWETNYYYWKKNEVVVFVKHTKHKTYGEKTYLVVFTKEKNEKSCCGGEYEKGRQRRSSRRWKKPHLGQVLYTIMCCIHLCENIKCNARFFNIFICLHTTHYTQIHAHPHFDDRHSHST